MSGWNKRYVPYPLLAHWTSDYHTGIGFGVKIPHSTRDDKGNLNLTVQYELNSKYLKGLVESGKAKYLSVIECNRTFSRLSQSPSEKESEDIFVEQLSDFSDSLSLVPYVVATRPLPHFLSDEHADEIRYIKPEGFHIAPWSMLARGAEQRIELDSNSNPNSVIDLVGSEELEEGAFNIDLNENRIKIYVSHSDFPTIDAFRNNKTSIEPERAALVPALYMQAVVEALRNLSSNEDRRWHQTMVKALGEKKIEVDNEELRDNALKYAQALMANPLGTMLRSFQRGDD